MMIGGVVVREELHQKVMSEQASLNGERNEHAVAFGLKGLGKTGCLTFGRIFLFMTKARPKRQTGG